MQEIKALSLSKKAFAPFGDILDTQGTPDRIINHGKCERYNDLAKLDILDGPAGISLFNAVARSLPYQLNMMERHPLGSQAFIPMINEPFLITVAKDHQGHPDRPQAFLSSPGQAVNLHRNIWHGVLTPLQEPGLFAVIDRVGAGSNLEEVFFKTPYLITS
ncbi:MAG: Ureidoglycolate hydrolase [Rhodobacteraceae bacterium]|nr:Ureidoglycolate hydrolase [Paracoccaceae bacterium]